MRQKGVVRMSVLRRLEGIPWWIWASLLGVSFLIMVVGAGWFPLFVVSLGWMLAALLRRWPDLAEESRTGDEWSGSELPGGRDRLDQSERPDIQPSDRGRPDIGQRGPRISISQMAGQPQDMTEAMVARMSDAQLYELWAQTSHDLRHKYLPTSILSHAQLREALLEEMTRRHPDVIDRWLADRPDQRDPRTYLGRR